MPSLICFVLLFPLCSAFIVCVANAVLHMGTCELLIVYFFNLLSEAERDFKLTHKALRSKDSVDSKGEGRGEGGGN